MTTAFAPIITSSPIEIGPRSLAPAPTSTRFPSPRRSTYPGVSQADSHTIANHAVIPEHRVPTDDDAPEVIDPEPPA